VNRLKQFFLRRDLYHDLDDEIAFHLEERERELVAGGMPASEAHAAAYREFGNVGLLKESAREAWGWRWLEDLSADLRFGARMLRKAPGFTIAAIITLALGIGANTAVFSMANALVFRPLPVKDAGRLMVVAARPSQYDPPFPLSYAAFLDFQRANNVFVEMTGYALNLDGLGSQEHADRVVACYTPGNFFTMLGLRPALGRLFVPGEGDARRSAPFIVLGYSYWQRRFASDQKVVGQTVNLDGQAVTVIGVVEKAFKGPYAMIDVDVYAPVGMYGGATGSTSFLTARENSDFRVLATLKPGLTTEQAESALNVVARQLGQQYPQTDQGRIMRVIPEGLARPEPAVSDSSKLVTTVFLLMVALVLLVACINVANLLLARATARAKEMAVRAAVGAGRLRLIRQSLTESILLAVAGGAVGAVIGNWACRALEQLRPIGDFPIRIGFTFDWRVFSYVTAIVLAAGVLAGLVPALRMRRTNLVETLREGGRTVIGDSGHHWLRNFLVIGQLAGSLIVLVAAGLFVRSLAGAESVDLGFERRNVLNVGMNPAQQGYDQPRAEAFFRVLLRKVRALPGVQSASLAFSVPISYYNDGGVVYAEGQELTAKGRAPGAGFNSVSPGYFETLGIPILQGRAFNDTDTAGTNPVAVINEEMAKRLWPGQDPMGRRFSSISASGPFVTVVGVARNAKYNVISEESRMYFYLPLTQNYKQIHMLQLRTSLPPETLIPTIEAQVREIDPNLPMFDVMGMEKSLQGGNGFLLYKMAAALAGILGALGLVLAVVGVYGVVSYTASLRKHEIGVRMALGAHPRKIFGLVLRQAVILISAGVGFGLAATLGVTRFLSSLLVGVSSYDPATLVGVPALLSVVALVACYLPARRATRVDPMVALRYE